MKLFLEIILIIIAVVIIGYVLFYSADVLLSPTTQQSIENKVCFGDNCFSVELARTEVEREKGLMKRAQLDKDKGMLFIFDKEGIYPFWMKDTLIPLDIIWIDSNGKVVFIGQNIQPCKSFICPQVNPFTKAKYVLEINGGLSKELGIELGQEMKFAIK